MSFSVVIQTNFIMCFAMLEIFTSAVRVRKGGEKAEEETGSGRVGEEREQECESASKIYTRKR